MDENEITWIDCRMARDAFDKVASRKHVRLELGPGQLSRILGTDGTRQRRYARITAKNIRAFAGLCRIGEETLVVRDPGVLSTIRDHLFEAPERARPTNGACYRRTPSSGQPEAHLGLRPHPPRPGEITFVKWHDPGGPGYPEGYDYGVPNRVLMLDREFKGTVIWQEFYLVSADPAGKERWSEPLHEWIEVDPQAGALPGVGRGILLRRRDRERRLVNNRVRVLEFVIRRDAAEHLGQFRNRERPDPPTLYGRWTFLSPNADLSSATAPHLGLRDRPYQPIHTLVLTQVRHD